MLSYMQNIDDFVGNLFTYFQIHAEYLMSCINNYLSMHAISAIKHRNSYYIDNLSYKPYRRDK